jgi:formate hydrogenlyase subunit 3/multisubunit Na+/H+ antiporter MnhD subunit
MTLLVAAIVVLVAGGALALALSPWSGLASASGAGSAVVGCVLGLIHTIGVLRDGPSTTLALAWDIPYGRLKVQTDALSAFFLAPLFVLGALAALYGAGYLREHGRHRSLGPAWMAYNALLASMVLVLVARQAVLFLVAWEAMVVASYVCVTFEYEKREVARAGWVYLVASHVGTAALVAFFLLFGRQAGRFDFDALQVASPTPVAAGALGALALLGFGVKAGFVPLHVWLPEAHAAAPSHVSAVMSGVLVNMGLYGVMRTLLLLREPPAWVGLVLVVLGVLGAVVGVALASYQRDLKRVLAYSTIENLGLVTLGTGLGMWGRTTGRPVVAALGFSAALLHVWNHSLMKGLMFLTAGSVLHGTGTRDLERLGGVMGRMPRTGALMVLGSVAIAGLPPLNGFVSEWLLYLALIQGALSSTGATSVLALLLVGGLSFVGALAGLAFVRLVGTALLGQPRGEGAAHAHESPALMILPMAVLAGGCIAVALSPQGVLSAIGAAAAGLLHVDGTLAAAHASLVVLSRVDAAVLAMLGAGAGLAALVMRRRPMASGGTWGCGYAQPTSRMQYTARSFSEALSEHLLPRALRPRVLAPSLPATLFPQSAVFESSSDDPLTRGFFEPLLARWANRFARLRWMQQGILHIYLVYIVVALLTGLAWSSVASWSGW